MDGIDHAKYFAIHAFASVIQLKVIKIIRDSDVISLRPLIESSCYLFPFSMELAVCYSNLEHNLYIKKNTFVEWLDGMVL